MDYFHAFLSPVLGAGLVRRVELRDARVQVDPAGLREDLGHDLERLGELDDRVLVHARERRREGLDSVREPGHTPHGGTGTLLHVDSFIKAMFTRETVKKGIAFHT